MFAFFLSLLLLLLPHKIEAIYDPLSVPNNKYGMHIADLGDIADVATLVNSTGGDWGYITLVASDNDRDPGRWQEMFNKMRRLHLIPIVRLATHVEGDHWVKPNPGTFDELVAFFNKLNWPIENRYIVLYNEPNHAKEWGNRIEPEEYADYAIDLARKFKSVSEDFYILPAGVDVSAASDGASMDAVQFIRRIFESRPEFIDYIDGWTSHSYPNPAFSGSPLATGRGTIRSFDWELSFLARLGLSKKLPVFITETGWAHAEGTSYQGGLFPSEKVGLNLAVAASAAWADPRIVAVTPFVFNYQDVPFDHFSWKRLSGDGGFYEQYDFYRNVPKQAGKPVQKESYALKAPILPSVVVAGSTYTLRAEIKNTGQGILADSGYDLMLDANIAGFTLLSDPLPVLEPGESGELVIHLRVPDQLGAYQTTLSLERFGRRTLLQSQPVEVVAPPSVAIKTRLGWRSRADASDVMVLIYDDNYLLHKFAGQTLAGGVVKVEGLTGILPGQAYRIVLLVPYYLPRQTVSIVGAGETSVSLKRMLPLDFNRDGAATIKDLFAMIRMRPHDIFSLFVGNEP